MHLLVPVYYLSLLTCKTIFTNMHILMADDDKDDFYIFKEAAKSISDTLKISYAGNWIELSRFMLKILPDVIFLDLNMPVKNGLECLHLLREDKKYDDIPIIIYSASVSKTDIDQAYKNRANHFIIKPNSIEDIADMIKKLCATDRKTLLSVPPREEFVII